MSKRWKILSKMIIGKQDNPMLKRIRVVQTPWFGIYLHFIYREDMDRDPHDHPWVFWRIVLKGGYIEDFFFKPASQTSAIGRMHMPFWARNQPFRWFNKFPVDQAHRITQVEPGTVTLVIVGPKNRTWGFWTPAVIRQHPDDYYETRRFIPWHKYVVNPVWSQEKRP